MAKSLILLGRPGVGKTRFKNVIAKHYKLKQIIDDGEESQELLYKLAPKEGALIITNDLTHKLRRGKIRVVRFEKLPKALKEKIKRCSRLTATEAKLILSVEKGADIYGYGEAGAFRKIQRRGLDDLLHFCKPQMYAGNGADRMPYFGIIATKAGIKEAKKVLKGKSKNAKRNTK